MRDHLVPIIGSSLIAATAAIIVGLLGGPQWAVAMTSVIVYLVVFNS